jgi:DNA-directed RNA polymerase subunit M/transcription elongation factor TFIIS
MPKARKTTAELEDSDDEGGSFLTPKSKKEKVSPAIRKSSSRTSSTDSRIGTPSPKKREVIPTDQLLGKFVQSVIEKEWKTEDWEPSNGFVIREKSQKLLYRAFASEKKQHATQEDALEHDEKCQTFAHAVEQSVYSVYFVKDRAAYIRQMRDLIRNIRKNPSRFLKIDPSFTATMSLREMVDYKKKQKREISDYKKENVYGNRKVSDVYCRKCKGMNLGSYDVGSRSADEGAISHYQCFDCGERF